jgi:hypothetical protein
MAANLAAANPASTRRVDDMALPKNLETPRGRYLQNIVDATLESEWADWPAPTKEDYTLIGGLIVMYSYIDLNLRRLAEATDRVGLMPPPWKGKVANLNITDTEKAILSLPEWSEQNIYALNGIVELRGMRNLAAHFAIRRFPAEEAFLFLTKSARDYKREFGGNPEPGMLFTGIVDREQFKGAFKHVEGLQVWLSKATAQAEKMLVRTSNPDVRE